MKEAANFCSFVRVRLNDESSEALLDEEVDGRLSVRRSLYSCCCGPVGEIITYHYLLEKVVNSNIKISLSNKNSMEKYISE